jgi:hypothetical protein
MIDVCMYCRGHARMHRKLRPRYDEAYKDGQLIGYYRITPNQCKVCHAVMYWQSLKELGLNYWSLPKLVTERQYNGASVAVGKIRIGSTVSDYTRRISRGICTKF